MDQIVNVTGKIVDATSLVVFIPGVFGLILLAKELTKKTVSLSFVIIIAIMFLWRLFLPITSSRYVILFLLLFSFLASFFIVKLTNNIKKGKSLYWISIIVFIVPFFFSTVKQTQANQSLIDAIEAITHYNNSEDYIFLTETKDYPRIKYYSGLSDYSLVNNSFDKEKFIS